MTGYNFRVSDDPADIIHVDVQGTLTEQEQRDLIEYFRWWRSERAKAVERSAADERSD